MWKQYEKGKNADRSDDDDYDYHRSRKIKKDDKFRGRMYSDDVRDRKQIAAPTKAGIWTKRLMEFEENDPDRWGHSGFKELYPGDFDSAEEQDAIRPEEETNDNEKANEDDDDKDDIVEKWKKGRFRPRVENRRPIGGNFRGRGRRGVGRGNFGGNFQRSILDVRRQEGRQRRDRRERPRSKSHEADDSGRKRLPGRFDRRRSRSESQEHALLKDGETANRHGRKDPVEERSNRRPGHAGQDKPIATERKRRPIESEYKGGKADKRSRSREGKGRFESDGKAISGEGCEKTEKKQGDTSAKRPNQRWDQIEKSEGDLMGLKSDAREKETIDINREEMKTEAQEKSFRGRWDENEDDDEDAGRKLLDTSEGRYVRERKDGEDENMQQKAAKVDMFGRDISKRYEYIEKKKTNNRPREAVQKDYDSKRKGAKKEEIAIVENSEHPSSMNRVGSVGEDVGSESDNDIRKEKEKLKKKKKHKKKEKKKKKHKKRKEEDSGSADSDKERDPVAGDTAHDSKRTEAAIAELNRIEKIQQEQELANPVDDQQKPGFSISLDAEAEMRERIKLKMKNRSRSLKSENVLNLEAFSKNNEDSIHLNESAREEKNEHIVGYMERSPELAGTKILELNASEGRVYRKNDRLSRSARKEGLNSDNSEVLVISSNKEHYVRSIEDSRRLSDHSASGEENSLERTSRSKARGENDRKNQESSSKRKARVVKRSDSREESESEYHQIARQSIGKKRGKREVKEERKRKMDDDQNSFTSDEETEQVARRNRRQKKEEYGKEKAHRDASNDFHSSDRETRKKKVGSSLGLTSKGKKHNSDYSSSESIEVKGKRNRKGELRKYQNDSSESFSSDEEAPSKQGGSYTRRGGKSREKDERSVAKKKRSKGFESESEDETRRVKDKENYSSRRRGRQDTKKVWREITASSSNNTDAGSGNEQSDSYESRKGSSKQASRKRNIEKQSREGLIHRDYDDREAKRSSKKEVKRQKEHSKGKKRHYSDGDSSDDEDREQKKYRDEAKSRYHKAPKEKIRRKRESSASGLEDLDNEIETKKISKEKNKTRNPKRGDGGKYESDSDFEKVNEPMNEQKFEAEAKNSYSKFYADDGSKSLKRGGRWDVTRESREVEEPKSGGQGIGSEVVAGRETSRKLAPKIRQANIDEDDPYISYDKSLLATKKDSSDALSSSILLPSSKDGFNIISQKVKIIKKAKDSGSSSDVSLYGDIDIEALSRKRKHVRKSEDSTAVVKLQDRAHKQRKSVDSDDSSSDENAKPSKRETKGRQLRDSEERDSRLHSTSYESGKRSAKTRASRESSPPRRKSHRHRSDSRSSASERESSRRRRSRDMTRKKHRRSRSPKQRSASHSSLSSSSSAERWRRGSKSKRSDARKKTKSSKTRDRDYSSSFESSTSSSSGANRPKKRRK
eukprot:gene4707-21001_t